MFGKDKLAEVSSKAEVIASLPQANLWPHTVGLAARDSIKVTAGVRVVDTADKIYLEVVSR